MVDVQWEILDVDIHQEFKVTPTVKRGGETEKRFAKQNSIIKYKHFKIKCQ